MKLPSCLLTRYAFQRDRGEEAEVPMTKSVEVPEAKFRAEIGGGRTNLHPSHWPADVHQISIDGFSLLGLDSKGNLYLDGDRVYTVRRWSTVERVLASLGVLAACVGALASAVSAYAALYPSSLEHAAHNEATPESAQEWKIDWLERRMGSTGALAVNFPSESTSSATFQAAGVPIQFGLRGLKETSSGYEVEGFLGNLSSAVLGKCSVTFSMFDKESDKHEIVSKELPGLFAPGESSTFAVKIPAALKGAEQVTASKPKCGAVFYVDPDQP